MSKRAAVAAVVCTFVLFRWVSAQPQAQPAKVDFGRDVLPILQEQCVGCHGPDQQMNGLRLDRRSDAMRGGTLTIIAPGHGDTSRMILRLTGMTAGPQMPPTGPLPAEQIELLKTWIDQGASWPDEFSGDAPPMPVDANATAMIDALRNGDRAGFTKLLTANPGAAKLRGPGGNTPLMAAALYSDTATMKTLMDAGSDPNAKNSNDVTALMSAVPDVDKMRLLLDRGAGADARSNAGRTPLLIASGRRGAAEAVKLLLARGARADVQAANIFGGASVLVEAARTGDEAVFQALIAGGAKPQTAGPAAIVFAMRSGCASCADLLIRSAPPPVIGIAVTLLGPPLGDGRLIKDLIERGADTKATDREGRTLLMLAAASDMLPVETVNLLIQRGADVNARNPEGQTALSLAKQRGATPIVDALIKAGAKDESSAAPSLPALKPSPASSPRAAVERALPLLQKSDVAFIQKAGCVSCHQNTLTAMSVAAARKQGIRVNEQDAKGQLDAIGRFLDSWRDRLNQNLGIPGDSDTVSYIMLGLAAEGRASDATTDAMARFVKSQQWPDGHWQPLAHRPPIESSDIQVTAASMRGLQVYGPGVHKAEYDAAVQRAAAWLVSAKPQTTDAAAFRLLGLGWSKASKDVVQQAGRELIAQQRADGGWSQLPSLPSDAYATGQALVALRESGAIEAADPAFKKGVQFLLNSQMADGSWFVKSRVVPLQPYFDSGFPYAHDQWISATATNWATQALVHAMAPAAGSVH